MKTIVFGGAGFLGSHVADALSEKGHDVIIFDKTESQYLKDGQRMIVGNILDESHVEQVISGCDYVYDFAGLADVEIASTRPTDTVALNILATCNIIEACIIHGIKRFVYASSFYVHSDKGGFYRCSKQAAELYIEEYNRKYNLPFTILRYGSLYGPRARNTNGIRRMLISALKSGMIKHSGTGDEKREYIHVEDAAALSVKILDNEYMNKHITLTGIDSYRAKEVFELITEIVGRPIGVEYANEISDIHYNLTPYSFRPQSSYKLVAQCYHDLGQGLVECLREIEELGVEENER